MVWLIAALLAQGGPPLLTDDPGTPGNGNSELNLAFTLERFRHESLYEAPLLDFNYGVGERIQLKIELPWLLKHENPGPDASDSGTSFWDSSTASSITPRRRWMFRSTPRPSSERRLIRGGRDASGRDCPCFFRSRPHGRSALSASTWSSAISSRKKERTPGSG